MELLTSNVKIYSKNFFFHLLITERLKLNELAATFSQDIGLIFEAINDAVYFVLDKTAIR